jgi:hypothetical protein
MLGLLLLLATGSPAEGGQGWVCVLEETHRHYFCDGNPGVEKFKQVPKGAQAECIEFCTQTQEPGACNLVSGEICSYVNESECLKGGGKIQGKTISGPIVSGVCTFKEEVERALGANLPGVRPTSSACSFTEKDEDYNCEGNSVALDVLEVAPGNANACLGFCSSKKKAGRCSLVKTKFCFFIDAEKCKAGGGKLRHAKKEGVAIETGACKESAPAPTAAKPALDEKTISWWGRPSKPEEFLQRTYSFSSAMQPVEGANMQLRKDVVIAVRPTESLSELTCTAFDASGAELGHSFSRIAIPVRVQGNFVSFLEGAHHRDRVMLPGGQISCGIDLPALRLEARTEGMEVRLYTSPIEYMKMIR